MSTHSCIAVWDGNNGKAVYCHYDGYPEYMEKMLTTYYNNKELAEGLVELGDLSSVCPRLAPNPGETHTFENPVCGDNGITTAYHRDRKEPFNQSAFKSLRELFRIARKMDASHIYVFQTNLPGQGWEYIWNNTI